jgi:hypothetical protein
LAGPAALLDWKPIPWLDGQKNWPVGVTSVRRSRPCLGRDAGRTIAGILGPARSPPGGPSPDRCSTTIPHRRGGYSSQGVGRPGDLSNGHVRTPHRVRSLGLRNRDRLIALSGIGSPHPVRNEGDRLRRVGICSFVKATIDLPNGPISGSSEALEDRAS